MIKRWALTVAAIAALVGAALAVLSTVQHLRIMSEGLEQQSFCAISERINCDVVNASSYSEFLGVPIAWWGVCYYIAIGGMALLARFSKRERRSSVAAAWFMSIGGLLYSAFLSYVSATILGVWCVECLVMYSANIFLFIFLYVAMGIPVSGAMQFVRDYALAVFGRSSNLGFAPKVITQAVAVAAVFMVGWGAMAAWQSRAPQGEERASLDEKVKAFYMQSLHEIKIDPDWPVWGNPKATVTIVEFSEFQCPFCRMAAFSVKPYLQEFKGDVRFYFVNYPLDNACNDSMKMPMHQYACLAAKAAICAGEKGKFWKFHDELFRNQKQLSQQTIMKLAEKQGWNRDEFMACVESPETDKRVRADIAAAKAIYVTGTPSLFINGRKLRYWRDPKFLQAIVEEEIKRSSKLKGESSKEKL
ncbi:MAG: thioredoxin domain-containing protein [bacterium]